MAAEWTGVTAELAKTTKLPADMIAWFEGKGYEDYNDVAMACSSATSEDGITKTRNACKE